MNSYKALCANDQALGLSMSSMWTHERPALCFCLSEIKVLRQPVFIYITDHVGLAKLLKNICRMGIFQSFASFELISGLLQVLEHFLLISGFSKGYWVAWKHCIQ